jgi:hypothetical protein
VIAKGVRLRQGPSGGSTQLSAGRETRRGDRGASASGSPVRNERADPDWLADRLVLLGAKRQHLRSWYLAFRFAFPERESELIEEANEIEREIQLNALRNAEPYALYHPYPASAHVLFSAEASSLT